MHLFYLCWVSLGACFLLVALCLGMGFLLRCIGFSFQRAILSQSRVSRHMGSVVVLQRLSCPSHVESSQTRGQNNAPCIGRRVLNHQNTREVSSIGFLVE